MAYVIGEPEFIKNVDDWLFKNEQRNADYIASRSSGIPAIFKQYSKALYRGMLVDQTFLEQLDKGGVTFRTHSSWSKSQDLAKKFASDDKYQLGTSKGSIRILVTKTISPSNILFDIHGYVSFMGQDQLIMLGMDDMSVDSALNEQEVLIKKGIKVTKSQVKMF